MLPARRTLATHHTIARRSLIAAGATLTAGAAAQPARSARILVGFAAGGPIPGNPAAESMPRFLGVQVGRSLGVPVTHVPHRGSVGRLPPGRRSSHPPASGRRTEGVAAGMVG
jgi:tripartite-type tricarboxylate transporter receptor subunit TctC